ncbi:MAG: pyridoxal phosphate-dependent aminotransferase [Epsilonproteobacteria bacterium]|nr:pyridoxal phosphate-dependent aminotransferase [Campylobacterota bacterium]
MKLSNRSAHFSQSLIRSMSIACKAQNGINMAQGICDLEVPAVVLEGAKKAMDKGTNIYTPTEGLTPLRQAIASKMKNFYNLSVDPQNEILVSDGATGAFYTACLALLNPEDEVIMFEPYYGYHKATLESVGAVPTYVRLEAPEWKLQEDALNLVLTDKTKAILICNPANPSGKVFSKAELEMIGAFATKHDLVVFSDEMYEHFIYDNLTHIPALSIPTLKERTVLISGFSKVFSVTGWRLGYAIAPEPIISAMAHFNDLIYVCAPAPLQMGVAEGLKRLQQDYYKTLKQTHQEKRDLFCQALQQYGLSPSIPQGAYYVMTDINHLIGADSKEKVIYLLEKTGIAAVPGSAFYHDDTGDQLCRFCYSKPINDLKEAIKGLSKL